jgi:uncharacterized protein involved in exopolysaccharide biosynthesis
VTGAWATPLETRSGKAHELLEARASLRAKIDEQNASLRGLRHSIEEFKRLGNELASAEAAAASALKAYETFKARFRSNADHSSGSMMNAPRLFIIDKPKDPEFPTVSRRTIFALGMSGNLFLSLFVVVAWEALARGSRASGSPTASG